MDNYIYIKKNWCKKCGYCIEFCPKNVLKFGKDGYPEPVNLDECIKCKMCIKICPEFAVIGNKDTKIKVEDR